MKLEEMQDLLDEDTKIDGTKLQWEASNNPTVYAKWLRIYSDVKKQITRLEAEKKVALKKRLDFYTGRGDELSMVSYEKSEMKTVLQADAEVLRIDTSIAIYLNMLDFATRALDIIKSRGFAIKNMIDIRGFEAGK